MELIVASAVGTLTAGGIYLVLRLRAFPVILGLAMLSYAVNVFLFSSGRLMTAAPPVLQKYGEATYSDPLPQALVLTAIVISFGMTAVLVMIALGSYLESSDDGVNVELDEPDIDDEPEDDQPIPVDGREGTV
jgi:multicomponent K+:H+ antiporter subunit C